MNLKVTLASASFALLMVNNSWAADKLPYYKIEEINVNTDGALYGPYPVALIESEGEDFIATYSMKSSLSNNVDVGLPLTFNRECQYDDDICKLEFEGSQNSAHLSYYNAYKKWRNAQSDAKLGNYVSYMFGSTATCSSSGDVTLNCDSETHIPFDSGQANTDVKVTDVFKSDSDSYVVGYSSAPYVGGQREFARRAFIKSLQGQTSTQLLPDTFSNDQGGFSSAYKIKEVNGKVVVIGAASRSFPKNNTEYFVDCYNSDEYDRRYGLNDLVNCPGFDTQAWVWDITDAGEQVVGQPLATHWLDGNSGNKGNSTYSASGFDINASGIAVGASSFEFRSNNEGARQRAIIMTPNEDGTYGAPKELFAATDDIEDQKDWIYNTWALTISDDGLVTGNREYSTSKGRNKAIEFFVYDNNSGAIKFPLKDKKVASRKQSDSNGKNQYIGKSGANSRVYAANSDGWMIGEVDDFDETDPVYGGAPRSQTAFLFNNSANDVTNEIWLMNDLICTETDGIVTSPRVRIRSARVIADSGVVLAEGFKYETDNDYRYKTNGVQTSFKLTPNEGIAPNSSPNCWNSELLKSTDVPYERQGAATFWMWLFVLPLLLIRRLKR